MRFFSITLIFCIALFFGLLAPLGHSELIDRTAAIVNSNVLTLSEVRQFRRDFELRKELDPFVAFFQFNPQGQKKTIAYLMQETLIYESFKPEKSEVEEEITSVLKKNRISKESLKDILKSQGVSYDTYLRLMGISLAKRKLLDRELRPLVNITEDEIKNYYYTASEFVKRKKKQKLMLSYDIVQMTIPNQLTADEVYKRITAGEDFEAVAVAFSSNGVQVNKLGMLREDSLSKTVRDSLEGLKVGDATKPLALGKSLYVIHRINRISAPTDPIFDRMKGQIQAVLYQKALERQLGLWTERKKLESYLFIP